jgi:hypothetical protein
MQNVQAQDGCKAPGMHRQRRGISMQHSDPSRWCFPAALESLESATQHPERTIDKDNDYGSSPLGP